MKQWGLKMSSSSMIDDLVYSYYPNSNKLSDVDDRVNDANSKLGDFKKLDTIGFNGYFYFYDENGNLTMDFNKGLTRRYTAGSFPFLEVGIIPGINYNYLNLPSLITKQNPGSYDVLGTIIYIYDASGNKLEKLVYDTTTNTTTTTTYIGPFVYQNDQLQFISHEEGRIRYAKKYFTNGDSAYQFINDYFLKDHLGNVRMVLTQQKDTAQYIATMEAAYRNKENSLFSNIPQSSYSAALVPGGYPTDNTTSPNDSLARVNGSNQKVGPALVLKVMSGDTIDIGVKSYYVSQGSGGGNSNYINDILGSLASGIVSITGDAKGTLTDLGNTSTSPLLGALNSFKTANDTTPTTNKPKAYLNWILLDEQFNYVSSYPQSGAIPVGNAGVLNTLSYSGIPVTRSGYLYIYVSNETQSWDVFFDNLSINHRTGPLLEETHYYPFGLTMAGISSKAFKGANYPENKHKFVSQELDDELGWDTYQFKFRTMDPQIGRFLQIDPLASQYVYNTTYAYAENRVTIGIDLEGKELYQTTTIAPGQKEKAWDLKIKVVNSDMGNDASEVKQRTNDAKQAISSTFSGKDAQGYDVKVNVDANVDQCADFSKDFIMNFTHDLPGHPAFSIGGIDLPEVPDAAGVTDKIGDVTSNVVSVVSTDVIKDAHKDEGYTDADAHANAANTAAHELGHAGGLMHDDTPGNLMNRYSATEGTITPQQRSIIGGNVPLSQSKTIIKSSMLSPDMKAFIPKSVYSVKNMTVVN